MLRACAVRVCVCDVGTDFKHVGPVGVPQSSRYVTGTMEDARRYVAPNTTATFISRGE